MKSFNKIFLIYLVIIAAGYTYSQDPVIIKLRRPPAYKINLEDMWKLTTENNSGTAYSDYFIGVVTKSGFNIVVEGTASFLEISSGTKILRRKQID